MTVSDRLKLHILASVAQEDGGDTDRILAVLATLNGETMISLTEIDRFGRHHDVKVKVDRVRSVGPYYEGGTVIVFTELETWDPKYRLVVEEEPHNVVRRLRENGWKY